MGTRTPGRDVEKYTKVTSEMSGVYQCKKELRELLLSRKDETSELKRLRASYLKPRWAATSIKFDEFVLDMFQKALDGAYPEDMWPYQDEFKAGMDRVFLVHLPRLRNRVEKQKSSRAGAGAAAAAMSWAMRNERLSDR